MAKIALVIGVSEYGSGLNPLPSAVKAVEAVQQVLQLSETDGFDEVKLLSNPNPPVMREAIETLFSERHKNDLVLLYFSGHVLQDDRGKLYFATSITCNNPREELIRVSAISASFVQDLMINSPCAHQVLILDCCLTHVSAEEMTVNPHNTADIKNQLGGNGRVMLTSFTSAPNSFELEDFDSSVYTRYLVEGIETGAADLDRDGWISVDELHEYASKKVQVVAPAIKPKFYPVEDGSKILLLNVPIGDPIVKYRKEAENWVNLGEINEAGRYILNKLAKSLQLTSEDCTAIEAKVLKPYQEYQEKLQRYKQQFAQAISKGYPLGTQEREELKIFQQSLGFRDEDVAPIEKRMALKLANLSQSEDDADQLAAWDSQSEGDSVFSTSNVVLPDYTPVLPVQPTNPTPVSEDNANELAKFGSESEGNSTPSTPNTVLPDHTRIPSVEPSNPTPAVNLSSILVGSPTSSPAVSTFPVKFLLPVGIIGALATVVLAIGISTRTAVAPPTAPADKVSSSPNSSPQPSPTTTKSDKEPSPSPSASPESKDCLVSVNGNLRSEPAPFRNNIIEALREPLPVTGKQTIGGWVEVKLPSNKLAWAHRDIIKNKQEMDACLPKNGISIKTVEDIPPPPPSSSLQTGN
ncbi:MAG TPA: caspase family protein [Candidatus Sericytochromatia bacterium]|jgi:hypothetical protein